MIGHKGIKGMKGENGSVGDMVSFLSGTIICTGTQNRDLKERKVLWE